MQEIKIIGAIDSILEGSYLLQKELGIEFSENGLVIEAVQRSGDLRIIKSTNRNVIYFNHSSHFYRGLVHWLQMKYNEEKIEEVQFKELGTMIDLSRNAVLNVRGFQEILKRIAILGFDSVLLYMEDTYVVEEYPYFGYMRGRYTKKELQELDQFASKLGIELIPCIQTLAHLKVPLKWAFGTEIKDTADCLLVGEEATYRFIEAMIRSVRDIFSTDKIHIGMDEALQLGLGKYLEKHGYQDRFDIFMEHLCKVIDITKKYHFKPMMWSDMFLRIGSKSGYYYDTESYIPKDVIKEIPDVSLVYWDYYNPDIETYSDIIKIHQKLEKELIFAGGVWIFNGIAPNYGRTIQTTNSALEACKKNNVKKVYATLWMDDGAETPIESSYLGLQLFAEHQFNRRPRLETVIEHFEKFQKGSYNFFMLLDEFDQTPGVIENNRYSSAVSKLILYQDLLLGLYDQTIAPYNLNTHYLKLHNKIKETSVEKEYQEIFDFYQQLALVLAEKSTLGIRIKEAYDDKNNKEMLLIINEIKELGLNISKLENYHQACWYKMNKTIGFEVLEIRYGGIKNRLNSVMKRLEEWMEHNHIIIEELSDERLVFKDFNSSYEGSLGRNFYQEIVTPNILSNH